MRSLTEAYKDMNKEILLESSQETWTVTYIDKNSGDKASVSVKDEQEARRKQRELESRGHKEVSMNAVSVNEEVNKLSGNSLVSALTSACLSAWYELINGFNARPEIYDVSKQGIEHDSYNIFKMTPGSDVKEKAFDSITKTTNNLCSQLNKLMASEEFEPRISRVSGKLQTLVAYTRAKGGIFQCRADIEEGHTKIFLTMPKEHELERAFSAMTDTPHSGNNSLGDDFEDEEVAGDPAPDYNDEYDVAGDVETNPKGKRQYDTSDDFLESYNPEIDEEKIFALDTQSLIQARDSSTNYELKERLTQEIRRRRMKNSLEEAKIPRTNNYSSGFYNKAGLKGIGVSGEKAQAQHDKMWNNAFKVVYSIADEAGLLYAKKSPKALIRDFLDSKLGEKVYDLITLKTKRGHRVIKNPEKKPEVVKMLTRYIVMHESLKIDEARMDTYKYARGQNFGVRSFGQGDKRLNPKEVYGGKTFAKFIGKDFLNLHKSGSANYDFFSKKVLEMNDDETAQYFWFIATGEKTQMTKEQISDEILSYKSLKEEAPTNSVTNNKGNATVHAPYAGKKQFHRRKKKEC